MANSTDPQAATRTAPDAVAPQAAPQPTMEAPIVINGRTFDLRGLTGTTQQEIAVANRNGRELYAALPQEYKEEADQVAKFLVEYRSVILFTKEVGGRNTVAQYAEWCRQGGEAGLDGANEAMRAVHRRFREICADTPVARDMQRTGDIGDFLGGFVGGTVSAPGRLWRAGSVLGSAMGDEMDLSRISEAQAQTFGACYAGLMCSQRQHDASLPFINWPGKESKIFNDMGSYATAATRYVASLMSRTWKMITGKGWEGFPNFGELLQEEKFKHQNARVTDTIGQLGTVAGIAETAEITNALQGSVVARNNGELVTVDASPTGLAMAPVLGPDGKPVTAMGRAGSEALNTFTDPMKDKSAANKAGQVTGTVVGLGLTTAAAVAVPGMAITQLPTVVGAFRNTYETAPLRRAENLEARAAGSRAERKLFDPRTWFNSEGRANMRDAQATREMGVAGDRAGGQDLDEMHARRAALPVEPKTTFLQKGWNFIRHPIRGTAEAVRGVPEAVGNMLGKGADGADRMVRGTAGDVGMIAADAKGMVTGSNAGLSTVGRWATRIGSVGRFAPRGLGIASNVLGAVGDTADGVVAAEKGDGRAVARSGGRVAGGLLGGFLGGAAAGAAVGGVCGGLPAIPGAILGGVVGCLGALGGYMFGRAGGGAVTEAVAGDLVENTFFRNKGAVTTPDSARVRDGALGPVEPGLQAALDQNGGRTAFARVNASAAGSAQYNEQGELMTPQRMSMREAAPQQPARRSEQLAIG